MAKRAEDLPELSLGPDEDFIIDTSGKYINDLGNFKHHKDKSSNNESKRVSKVNKFGASTESLFMPWKSNGNRRSKKRKKRKKKLTASQKFIRTCFTILIVVPIIVVVVYILSDLNANGDKYLASYTSLGEEGEFNSKADFEKVFKFLSIYRDSNDNLQIGMNNKSESEVKQTMGEDVEVEDDTSTDEDISIPSNINIPNDYWAYVKDAGISTDGVKSNITVDINGTKVNLYNGIPKEWNASADQSHIIFYDKVETAWREGYKQAFGHDYPNKIQKGGWTNDSIFNGSSTLGDPNKRNSLGITSPINTGVNSSGSTYYKDSAWLSNGVLCVGFCPNPFMATHEFKFGATGSASIAYNYRWLIVLEQNDKYMYLPALGSDAMSHMWPGACYQTFASKENESSPIAFPKAVGYKNYKDDWGDTYTNIKEAIERLESGGASPHHSTNKNNTIQYKIEGVRLNSLKNCGWNFYGVICVK